MNIGSNIRTLRRSRNMTQQELAEVFGVSFQSVSKWECGDGYPDITLLPDIARYFGVTLDALMDMDGEKYRREVQETADRWSELQKQPDYTWRQGADFLREQIGKQPAEWAWHFWLAQLLNGTGTRRGATVTETERREAVSIMEHVYNCANGETVRDAALEHLSQSYSQLGECEKAVETAQKITDRTAQRRALLYVRRGPEQLKMLQLEFHDHISELSRVTRFVYPDAVDACFDGIGDTYPVDGDCFGLTQEDKILLLEKGVTALSLQCDGGEKAYGGSLIAHHYRGMAYFAAQLGQHERALGYLESAIEYLSAAIDQQVSGDRDANRSLMISGLMDPAFDNAFHRAKYFREYIETCPVFGALRGNARYAAILARLGAWLTPENCEKYRA